MKQTTFIYVLVDPRDLSPKINRIRYVGKSNDPIKRLRSHIKFALQRRYHRDIWICELIALGLEPIVKILEEVPYSNWQEREIYWIAFFKSHNAPLTNETAGGEGSDAYTPEFGQKISDAMKRAYETTDLAKKVSEAGKGKLKPGTSAALKGRKRPDIAAAHLGKKRPKISEALKGKKRGPNSKPSPLKGKSISPETKAKISQSFTGSKLIVDEFGKRRFVKPDSSSENL